MTKTARPWGATGVIPLPRYELCEDDRDAIRIALRIGPKHGIEGSMFFEAVSEAIALYHGHVAMAESSSPKMVRRNLDKIEKLARELAEALIDSDGNSKQLYDEGHVGYRAVFEASNTVLTETIRARARASEYQEGRLPDHPAIDLCERVAQALEDHLDIKATTTRDGPLMAVMDVVLLAATGREPLACHDLVARAMRRRRAEKSK